MTEITLKKIQELSLKVDSLKDDQELKESDYRDMIYAVEQIEIKVESNKDFYLDWEKIVVACKFIIFKLELKITEILENNFYLSKTRH